MHQAHLHSAHTMAGCTGSACISQQRSLHYAKPPQCSTCQRRVKVAAAYQNSNGPASEYRPTSRATRIATAPEPQFNTTSAAGSVAGPQLKQWLRSPFDVLALGPRATLGAMLNAAELAQSLPAEIEKLQMLAQDPRPVQEKQAVLAQEIEATVAALVERGVVAESEIVASLQAVLPEQFQQLIPSELRNVVPQSPTTVQQQAQEGFYEEPPLSAEQLSVSQSAEELAELKAAVVGVKEALKDLRANVEPARTSVLKVNVRDARDSLRRRVNQISPETSAIQGAPVIAATSEASSLLAEVDGVISA